MPNTYQQTSFFVGIDNSGDVQMINIGKSDDTTPIYYELETQELDFGNRASLKKIADKICILGRQTDASSLQAQENDGDYKNIPLSMEKQVNIGKDINLEGNFFTFRLFGESSTQSPIFEGFAVENINDLGITNG